MRGTSVSACAALLLFASCGQAPNLPALRARSEHFRYFAGSSADGPPDLLAALEANRQDVLAYLQTENNSTIDYYRLDDGAEVTRHCPSADGCTIGNQIFTTVPIHYHELIHAYLAPVGSPSNMVAEGVATAINCFEQFEPSPVVTDWHELFGKTDVSVDFYNSSMQLIRYLLLTFGPQRFVDYYAQAPASNDASVFAENFNKYWGMSFDQVWISAQVGNAPKQPICPCKAPAIDNSGNVQSIAHEFGWDYRTIDVGTSSTLAMSVSSSESSTVELLDCQRTFPPSLLASAGPQGGSGVSLIQLDMPPRFIRFDEPGSDNLTVTSDSPMHSACEMAGPLEIDATTSSLSIVIPPGDQRYYVSLASQQPFTLSRTRALQGALRLCTDCSQSDCRMIPPYPDLIGVDTSALLVIDASSLPDAGLVEFYSLIAPQ